MKKIYFLKRLVVLAFFSFPILLVSTEVVGQATSCNVFNQSCTDFGATTITFNSGNQGFSGSGGITYSGGSFSATVAPSSGGTYVITTANFTLQDNLIAIGFNTTGSTAGLNSYSVEVLRTSDNLQLAVCPNTANPAAAPICYSISDADMVAGTVVYFRITISATNSSGSAQTVIFDDFTYNAGQLVLPVSLGAFNLGRKDGTVNLKWRTLSELNSSGFEIQRKDGNNAAFKTIAFVKSKAITGNATSTLEYEFTDNNAFSDVSFYRLRLVNMDGTGKLTETKAVTGISGRNKLLIYPNPSNAKKITAFFGSGDSKDIRLLDISGRNLRNWKGYRDTDLVIEDLKPGLYILKVINLKTRTTDLQKIMIIQ